MVSGGFLLTSQISLITRLLAQSKPPKAHIRVNNIWSNQILTNPKSK